MTVHTTTATALRKKETITTTTKTNIQWMLKVDDSLLLLSPTNLYYSCLRCNWKFSKKKKRTETKLEEYHVMIKIVWQNFTLFSIADRFVFCIKVICVYWPLVLSVCSCFREVEKERESVCGEKYGTYFQLCLNYLIGKHLYQQGVYVIIMD